MYDKQVVLDILNQIHEAIQRIIRHSELRCLPFDNDTIKAIEESA